MKHKVNQWINHKQNKKMTTEKLSQWFTVFNLLIEKVKCLLELCTMKIIIQYCVTFLYLVNKFYCNHRSISSRYSRIIFLKINTCIRLYNCQHVYHYIVMKNILHQNNIVMFVVDSKFYLHHKELHVTWWNTVVRILT